MVEFYYLFGGGETYIRLEENFIIFSQKKKYEDATSKKV
jgi:hypothetical protein